MKINRICSFISENIKWLCSRIKSGKIDAKARHNAKALLVEAAKTAYREWSAANNNFDTAENGALIDYYIYTIKAAEAKMEYFLKKIKEENNKKQCF